MPLANMNDMLRHGCVVGAFDLVSYDFLQNILGAGKRVGIEFLAFGA